MSDGAGATVIVRLCVAAWPVASTTRTVNGKVPPAVGTPDSRPVVGTRLSPGGRPPALTDQVTGAVPPVTVSWSEYGDPTSAGGGAGSARPGETLTVTADDRVDAGPVPAALTAATVNV